MAEKRMTQPFVNSFSNRPYKRSVSQLIVMVSLATECNVDIVYMRSWSVDVVDSEIGRQWTAT